MQSRIEARVDEEIKKLAERAAALSGMSLTDYLVKLIREDAPNAIKINSEIVISNQDFDKFIALCDTPPKLSKKIIDAAKQLDDEGF